MTPNRVAMWRLLLMFALCLLPAERWACAQDPAPAQTAEADPAAPAPTQAEAAAPAQADGESSQVLEMIVSGGLPLYVIFGLFAWAIWLGCLKCWEFHKTRQEKAAFAESVIDAADRDKALRSQSFPDGQVPPEDSEPYVKALIVGAKSKACAAGLEQASQRPASATSLIRFALGNGQHEPEAMELALDNKIELDMLPALRRGVSKLATIAKGAPMLGLLGTVWGMIGAFARIASATNVNPNELADNIGLALTTTAAGLGVAIPGIALHCCLTEWARHIEIKMLKQAQELVDGKAPGKT